MPKMDVQVWLALEIRIAAGHPRLMSHLSGISIAVTAVTVTASSLSVVGTGFIIVCYAILPLKYHLRCVLILNLAVAGEH